MSLIFPDTFLVIDGIDECDSPLTFMSQLYKICDQSKTKTIVLGRPSIGTPAKFKNQQIELHLQPDRNLEDIQTYLKDELEELLDWIKISGGLSVKALVLELSLKANGMFLWAYLVIQYLQCKALSPNERLEVIKRHFFGRRPR
jgi:hypothetical protein